MSGGFVLNPVTGGPRVGYDVFPKN